MWNEHPKYILSTNFHRGVMIPAGTKVIILGYGRGKVRFRTEPEAKEYVFEHAVRHSTISLRKEFERVFGEKDPKASAGTYAAFSSKEKENIDNGVIDIGMSKAVALIAYGYLPSHGAQLLESNTWIYWKSRAQQVFVYFNGDKVNSIDE